MDRIRQTDLITAIGWVAVSAVLISLMFPLFVPQVGLVKLCATAVFLFVLILKSSNKILDIRIGGIFAAWVLFLGYVIANRGVAFLSGDGLSWLFYFCSFLFLAILMARDKTDWVDGIFMIIAICASVHALATIAFWLMPDLYSGWYRPTFLSGLRVTEAGYKSALTTHYSTNGMYLALGLMVSFPRVLAGRRRKAWVFAVVLLLFAILLTTKRAHLVLGVLSCVIMYIAWHYKDGFNATCKLLVVASLAVFALYLASLYIPEITAVFDRLQNATDDDSFGGRANYYSVCIELWRANPLFGNGWNSFTDTFYSIPSDTLSKLISHGNFSQNAHCVYLQLLAEEGVLGLLLFANAAIRSLRIACGALSVRVEDMVVRQKLCLAGSVGVQSFFLLYGITGNPLYEQVEFIPFLIAISAVIAITNRDRTKQKIS